MPAKVTAKALPECGTTKQCGALFALFSLLQIILHEQFYGRGSRKIGPTQLYNSSNVKQFRVESCFGTLESCFLLFTTKVQKIGFFTPRKFGIKLPKISTIQLMTTFYRKADIGEISRVAEKLFTKIHRHKYSRGKKDRVDVIRDHAQ